MIVNMSLEKVSYFISLLFAFIGTGNGYYFHGESECLYSTTDYSDMVFLQSYSFNLALELQFNSTVGKFEGFTVEGLRQAEYFNNNQAFMQQIKAYVDTFCRHNAQIIDSNVRDKSVKPKVKLSSVKQAEGRHPAILLCSAYDFYPERIKVSWLRDGKVETTDVTSTMEMMDGDWFYQIHSHLEYTPKSGEKISCMVEHVSFNKPMIYDWDPSFSEADRNKIAIGASGLVLGIIIAAAGLIYYKKKKSTGRILVPN